MSIEPQTPQSTPPASETPWWKPFLMGVTICLLVSIPVGFLADWAAAAQVFVAAAGVATAVITVRRANS